MKKIIQYNEEGVVVDIFNAKIEATGGGVALTDGIPAFEPKEGYNGVLMFGDAGLYWDHVEVPVSDEISTEHALAIITGG